MSGIQLSSLYRADPHAVELNGLRLTALGGEFTGHAALQDFTEYKLDGNLRNLDLQTALRAVGEQLPYDAVISGPVSAEGDTKVPGTKSLAARAALSLAPGRRGIPVSGRLNANFSGAADNVTVTSSYLNLAHTRVTLDGSVNNHLNFSLTSRDLNDLLAAASLKGPAPVALNRRPTYLHWLGDWWSLRSAHRRQRGGQSLRRGGQAIRFPESGPAGLLFPGLDH